MNNTNEMLLEIQSLSRNEGFARMVIAGFVAQLDPTIEEIADIKTAVSEAVTNAIIHGYNSGDGKIQIYCRIIGRDVFIEVRDTGEGIENIEKAMEPLYTTRPELERSGMGFAFMEAFMDELSVDSKLGEGTTIKMQKRIH
ncbi:MAG: putative anti-sigma regulatory factor, serine/threonine protein kinase [Anaerocolumna sp.]|jgi:stage II sporulation protein AB (anti-sigma F factor)|nr:putative anti-sigma regulatory factor, serine/threonine protein kinase [Anaerocolumna sp.]